MSPEIFIYDEFLPEDIAMMQALYSRSSKSVTKHVENVKKTGSGSFMETYYVGYNHKSIGDCGTSTIFIEGVSELAAKAIQDWQLYSGQQTSTRYIDFTKQPVLDPVGTKESKEIIDSWMDFYKTNLDKVEEALKLKYPIDKDENEKIYNKAIKARCFDIMRSFLPAGVTTQLSWHTNFRQAWDKLSLLKYHPLAEISQLADSIIKKLKEKYPNSFSYKEYKEQEDYYKTVMLEYTYYPPRDKLTFRFNTNIEEGSLASYHEAFSNRPIKTELPSVLDELGNVTFDFVLDYGSFRDLQRHRHGVCRMPLLTTKLGFETWYLENLPDDVRAEALELIDKQKERISKLDTSNENKQYYHAMGFKCSCRVTYGLPAAVYVIELRSGVTVHPTLRTVAHKMHHALTDHFPVIKLHSDLSKDVFSVNRGKQDIIKK